MIQVANLLKQIKNFQEKKFTGQLKVDKNKSFWNLYFCQGKLVWATGGFSSLKYLQISLSKYGLEKELNKIDLKNLDYFDSNIYNVLTNLYQTKLVKREQLILVIEDQIKEILFDILSAENYKTLKYEVKTESLNSFLQFDFKIPLTLVNAEAIYQESYQMWLQWLQKGLQDWSPNLTPIIKNQEELKLLLPELIYARFLKLIDGKNTLRDLAYKMNKDLVELTYSLKSYIQKGLIELVENPTLVLPSVSEPITVVTNQVKSELPQPKQPLVVCIDDSLQVLQIMEQILTKAGYQFMGIQDPIQAVPKLLSCNPDLIFLDLGMPMINGYEVCSQLQRVSKLSDVPVVMLTGQNGIIDKIRAKIVGASSFISKPIEKEKILATVKEFVWQNSSESSSQLVEPDFLRIPAIA